ncbi:MAG: FAD:protein FMN transferase [Actinomycetota bacterium]
MNAAPVERELRVMGSPSFLVVHGGTVELLDRAEYRLRELESLWSRFRDDSDITRANQAAGHPVIVHEDTLAVVGRALDAWRQTNGRFDITVLPALLRAGYTHSTVDDSAAPAVPGTRIGQSALVQVDYAASTITVPAFGAIDLGGIGKGFAADVVAEELMEAGATGALVNIGGDLAVLGRPTDGATGRDGVWFMGIEDPRDPPHHVAVFRLLTGGVATSGTTVRKWTNDDGTVGHHLIDPTGAQPAKVGLATATVIASDAATAEVFATAAMMLPAQDAIAMLDATQLAGLVVTETGEVLRTNTLKDFLA